MEPRLSPTHKPRLFHAKCSWLTFFVLLLSLVTANCDLFFVSPTGNDGGEGTARSPYRTLRKAINEMRGGDVVQVHGGLYQEALLDNIPTGRDWLHPTRVQAVPGETPIISPMQGSPWVLHFGGGQAFIIVQGLVLDARNVGHDAVKITGGANHIRLEDCEILNSPRQGILITGEDSHANELVNLHVHENGKSDFQHGVYIETSRNWIHNSAIHHNAGWGIHVYGGLPLQNSFNSIQNSLVYLNGRAGRGPGIGLYSGDGHLASGNFVWMNKGGIYVEYGADHAWVLENHITGNNGYGVKIGETATYTQIESNLIVWNTGEPLLDEGQQSLFKGNHFAQENPESTVSWLQAFPPEIKGAELLEISSTEVGGVYSFLAGDIDQTTGVPVEVYSSNELLIPNENLVLFGTGAERNLLILPEDGQWGQSEIFIVAWNGNYQTTLSFLVEVGENGRMVPGRR